MLLALPSCVVHEVDSYSPLAPTNSTYKWPNLVKRRADADEDEDESKEGPSDDDIKIFNQSCGVEIIVLLEGIDAVTSDTIQARYSYTYDDIVWDRSFAPIVSEDDKGVIEVDYTRFHDTVPLSGGKSPPPTSE